MESTDDKINRIKELKVIEERYILELNSCIRNVKIWWQQLNFIKNFL